MMQNRIPLFGALAFALVSCGPPKPPPPPQPEPDKVCQEGTDPLAPAPPAFGENCPPLEEATLESCTKAGFLFSEGQRMCVKECPEPFQVEGQVCKGSGPGGNPGCSAPTPYRRCTGGNFCYCSSTP